MGTLVPFRQSNPYEERCDRTGDRIEVLRAELVELCRILEDVAG